MGNLTGLESRRDGMSADESWTENTGKIDGRPRTYTLTKTGAAILAGSGAVLAAVYAVAIPFVLPALRKICLPYVPATDNQVRNVFRILEGRRGTLIDLGSGDGRIVTEAAKLGYQATGIELNPWLVWYSRHSAWRKGLGQSSKFIRGDLWKVDVRNYDNIVIFGVEQMMASLQTKLKDEIGGETVIVACRFPLPDWQPSQTIESSIDSVWLYERDDERKTK